MVNIHRKHSRSGRGGGLQGPLTDVILAALRDGRPDIDQPSSAPAAQPRRAEDHAAVDALGPTPGAEIVARVLKDRPPASDDSGLGQRLTDKTTTPVRDAAMSTSLRSSAGNGFYDSQTTVVGQAEAEPDEDPPLTLRNEYRSIIDPQRLGGTPDYPLHELLGAGGQGKVFLSERRGADGFRQPLAVKVFSPDKYPTVRSYLTAMARQAEVGSLCTWPQNGNVVGVHGFEQRGQIRIMLMELVDGYDLCQLLDPQLPEQLHANLSHAQWDEVCRVVMVPAREGPRLQPGVAVSIIRDCLAGLDSLHRRGIVHGDIKLANIMLQRSGRAKIIDLGSAHHYQRPPRTLVYTPAYAAPETLEGHRQTRRSDLASLGYVLVELLAGKRIFAGIDRYSKLLEAKQTLPRRLNELLPADVRASNMLMGFCRRLIEPEVDKRWQSAESADLDQECGAAAFLNQLVLGNLASVYESEIRVWLNAVPTRRP